MSVRLSVISVVKKDTNEKIVQLVTNRDLIKCVQVVKDLVFYHGVIQFISLLNIKIGAAAQCVCDGLGLKFV